MAFNVSSAGTRGRTQPSLAEINVTPFVDVLLVLLIILMVTVPVVESGIEINVPQTRYVKEKDEERVTILINRKEQVFVGAEPVKLLDLGAHLKQLMRDPSRQQVYVRADKECTWGAVAKVVDQLRLEGITQINMVTKPYERGQQ